MEACGRKPVGMFGNVRAVFFSLSVTIRIVRRTIVEGQFCLFFNKTTEVFFSIKNFHEMIMIGDVVASFEISDNCRIYTSIQQSEK